MILTEASKSHDRVQLNNTFVNKNLIKWSKRLCLRTIIPCIILLIFCSPAGLTTSNSDYAIGNFTNYGQNNWLGSSEGQQAYSATGASQPVAFSGLFSNDSQSLIMVDSSTPTSVSLQAPNGWTGYNLGGSLEHLSTGLRPLKNGLLDDFHGERYIISGSPWNSEVFNVPDDWSVLKNGDTTSHPTHGGLYWYTSAGNGRESSMGWRPSVLFDTSKTLNPTMEIYLSQEVQLPWREVYSCTVTFYHRVPTQTMNDIFYLFMRVGNYEARFNVFSTGYTTNTWLQATVDVPASVFASIAVPGTVSLDIGLSTDFSGQPPSNINNFVFIDEIEAVFNARPFPEQIGLSANQTIIYGVTPGSVSPYVPDGAARDCFSRSDTGISTSSALEVGVWSSSGTSWNDVIKYQIGIQFPLNIPKGAVITYAALEVEALGYFGGGDNSLRVFVAEEDNLSPFTNGLPNLENRYSWSQTSVGWIQDSWDNGYRYETPDLSSLVQKVVSRSGWSSGNYIGLMIDYMNSDLYRDWNSIRGTFSYGGTDLAVLHVDFVVPQEEDTISVLKYSKDLTIDHTKVSSDLENFPVLVDIYDSDLKSHAQADGDDIRFMLGSETLDYELEVFDQNYNASHAHLTAWVKVPTLSGSTDTVISMHYGSESASGTENPKGVWGDDYDTVWHFSESSGSGSYILDSSGRTHDGFPMSTSYSQSGMINNARQFQDAAGNYMSVIEGDEFFDGELDWQLSFWLYTNFSSDSEWYISSAPYYGPEPHIFDKSNSLISARVFTWGGPEGTFQVDVHFDGAPTEYLNVGITNRAWNYIVMKYEGSGSGRLYGYSFLNGAPVSSGSTLVGSGISLVADPSNFLLGDTSSVFTGLIDEFRTISEGYKSLGWIETEYANQYDPSSFLSVGTELTSQFVFNNKKDIVVDHTKVSADLKDFPVLIDIFDTDLKTGVQSDGDDIMFKIDDTWLPHEIELFDQTYNSTHAHLVAWVKTDLSSSVDTSIAMYYGNPQATNHQDPDRVWNDKYNGVWHLGETSGNAKQSASWGTDCTVLGEPTRGFVGQVGYAYDFDGADDYIYLGSSNTQSTGTYSFWIYPHSVSNEINILAYDAYRNRIAIYNGRVRPETNTESEYFYFTSSSIAENAWQHVVFVRAGDFGDLYVNGVWIEQVETVGADTLTVDSIGGTVDIDRMFDGPIDEVRIAGTTRSLEWIETEYANQYDPSSFLNVGIEETVQYGQRSTLSFTTDVPSVVNILPRLTMNVIALETTLDKNMQPGTSFSVANGTQVTWTANVLASPQPGISNLSFNLIKPAIWTLTNVIDSVGQNRLSEVVTTGTQITVSSLVFNVTGIWTFKFSSTNEVSLLECGANAGAYGNTVALQIGDTAKFRGTATVIPGSAMRLHLIDPSGQLFYSTDDLSQDGSGFFEWTGISVTSAWPNGLWEVYVDFNNTADSSPERVGRYNQLFTVRQASSLDLLSPADAIGDGISVRTAGELLEVEVQLTNTETVENIAGATVMMNWSVLGVETQVQFEDYGNGVYGKTFNTSDLGLPGNWRLNIVSSHPYLIDATTFFDLELSHNTVLVYKTPTSTPYGSDFTVRMNLQDAITATFYDGASFTSNGTINGVTDYNNGTYLIAIDSTGYSIGTYCFRINAIPVQSFVIESSVDVVFRYRDIKTDLIQVEINPVSVPWGQNATIILNWQDIDNGDIGISGGTLSGDGTFQYTDLLDGRYSIQLDVESYNVGVYMFNFSISRTNYQSSAITVAVIVRPHRTLVVATYDGSIPLGANVTVTLQFLDRDAGNAAILGNLSSVLAEWTGGSAGYGLLQILIESQDWAIGTYTIDITVFATAAPRYFYDGTTAVLLNIQKLATALSWDDIDIFPIGDDFEITTYVSVNDSSSIYDGMPVNGLLQSHFTIRDKNGTLYNIKTFLAQGAGTYVLTLDKSYFLGGSYGIRVFVAFGVAENFSNIQTPIISFQFTQARCDLSSPDYPLLTISYNTDANVTLEFVDIDRGQGIDTATIYVTGAVKLGQQLITNGRYRVTIDTSSWGIGVYTVNFTASALNYENKTISIDIQIRQIRTFATATVGSLEIPVGDSRTFYVDYVDMDHDLPIFTLNHLCNWTPAHYDIVWLGNRYSITIHTFDTDALTSYLLIFDYSAGGNYESATFNVTVVVRSIKTELRLLKPVEDTTPSGQIDISVYYGDRDHLVGIVSSYVLCTVWNTTDQLTISWYNDTSAGYYIITIDASQFGGLGIQQLTVFFNWTGSIQKYENRYLSISVEIIGEETDLTLIEAALPSPCLEYMVYTFLYSSTTTGTGISNDTFNVFISVQFIGVTVDLSEVNIWEIDSSGSPGEYSIGFNNSILRRTGIISMKVFINWSAGVSPFYTNRTDLISVRVLPRTASLSVIPPTNVPYGENATFSFTYEDTTGGTSTAIAYDPIAMTLSLNVPDFTLTYNALEDLYTVSFNTSQLGAPLGARTFILNLAWSGLPFYSNITGRSIGITLIERQTLLTYPTPPVTPYGNNVTFTVTYVDIAGSTSKVVLTTIMEVYVGLTMIPSNYVQISNLGSGEYQFDLNTSYFSEPGVYSLRIEASSGEFYYQARSATKSLAVNFRTTILTAEPIGSIPYGSSFSIVLQYQDLDTLVPIGNGTGLMTDLEILNGTDWLFTCSWRPSLQNYLLTVETYNQALELGQIYNLWLNFSTEYTEPFYEWNDVLVPFEIRERDTSLDLISSPSQTRYQDYANFTILYKDSLSSSGISGGTITLYYGLVLLTPAIDYEITEVSPGQYAISVDSSVLGPPGVKTIQVIASWSAGQPYYSNAQRNINIPVTERPSNVEIVFPPGQTWYFDNVTFDFAFVDLSTGERIIVGLSDIKIFSGLALLSYGDYVIQTIGSIYRVQINSTVISANLVSNWNITVQIDWTTGAPYYRDDSTSIFVNTVGRVGNVELSPIEQTPFGDLMNISLIFTDQRTGMGIQDATVVLDCVEVPGLVEGVDYWVQMGTGIDSGKYRILVSTLSLGSLGVFTFEIEVQWSALVSPFYGNILAPELQGRVREIQTSVSSDLPSPSVVAFYEDISFVIHFSDTDHGLPINGAVGQISVNYASTGLEPSSWSVLALGLGQYNITLSMIDSLSVGLQSVIVTINLSPYEIAQTSVVFGLRNRVAGLSAVVAPTNYAGYATSVMIYLVDYDADDNPLPGANLILTWGDSKSYVDLGDGSYNLTLQTGNLNFGSQILNVQANLLHYSITSLNVEINLLSVPSELLVSWSGPTGTSEIYWGEPLTIFAAINDTLRNQTVSVSTITYDWDGGTGSFQPSGIPGNYTAILDTSLGTISDTIIVIIEGSAPNYIDSSYQLVFRLLPRPMDIIPEESYVFTVSYGAIAQVDVILEDGRGYGLVSEANLKASWDYASNLTLVEMPANPGHYRLIIPTESAGFGIYQIRIDASKQNYGDASVTLIMRVSQIQMVVWLDNVTATYEYTSFYWSEVVRIGVYVLAPALNASYPFSTGLDGLIVTWNSPELGTNGTLVNGILIGGSGYYYYDFNTSLGIAALHSFIISANPPNPDYTEADNSTSIFVRNREATIESPGSPEFVWGWTGLVNVTYFDSFNEQRVQADFSAFSWAGGAGSAVYLGEGVYGIPINTTSLRPGTYTITIEFRKANYEDTELTIRIHIASVPTEIVILLPEDYRIGDVWTNLRVPYGDTLTITLLYNDTYGAQGIPNAQFNNSFYSGPGVYEDPLVLTNHGNGNYSFVFSTLDWELYSTVSFHIRFMLENYTTAVFVFEINIIKIQTNLEIDGPSMMSLHWGVNTTFWVFYSDTWPTHSGVGITDATVVIDNQNPDFATVEYLGPDAARPGYYQFRVIALRAAGVAEVTIHFNKTYYDENEVSLSISVSPSQQDIDMQNAITFGGAFLIILILGSLVWVRILRVPKIIRILSGQIRQVRRGKVPKRAKEAKTRQALLAEIFNELYEPTGLRRKAAQMPGEPIVIEVPEIDELIIDLSILTGMTQQEIDDFRHEISKMKMSQQTSFVREVIRQEVIRVAGVQNKSLEQVIEEVVEERRRRIGGTSLPPKPEAYMAVEEEAEAVDEEEEGIDFENRMREFELEEMATELEKRGIPKHEIESFIEQARDLPKDIVEMLLQSFQPRERVEAAEKEIEHLTEKEIEELRAELIKRKASDREIESIIDQARSLPRELALDLIREPEEPPKKKKAKKVEVFSKEELKELKAELVKKGVPKKEIDSIMKQAKTVEKDKVEDFLKTIEDQELKAAPDEIEFEDKLTEIEVEDLRKQLKQRGLPDEEIESIVQQAKGLPSALIEDLLKSIDADLDKK